MSVKIFSVSKGSVASKAGIKAGQTLFSINNNCINDVLDYKFYSTDKKLNLVVDGKNIKIRKEEYEDLGLDFETYLMDEKRHCKNNCIFCFISQMPPNMRDALYFKDDDARLSFLQGNYITLTNISEKEVDRIIKMRLNINVSIHTTNPKLRCEMTKNPSAGKALEYFYKMANAGISMNCQIVLCPGINDGDELKSTLGKLCSLYPSVQSVAVVPVGLTKFRDNLPALKLFDKESAISTIGIIEGISNKMYNKYQDRVVYPADEFFLLAEKDIPHYDYYGDFAQYENGIGMWASLLDEFVHSLGKIGTLPSEIQEKSLVTGVLATPLLEKTVALLKEKVPKIKISVKTVHNDYFGRTITVAGLITGSDIIKQLVPVKEELGTLLLIPDTMIKANSELFLDDVTITEVEQALKIKIIKVKNDGYELLQAMLM